MITVPEQIDIMVNNECNAKCGFCVQKATYKSPTRDDQRFLSGVEKHVKDYYDLGGRKIIITGGEPTLRPQRVEKVLQTLTKFNGLELIAMYTNGSRLLREHDGMTIAHRLRNNGLQFINHSVHHHNTEKNREIFNLDDLADPREVAQHLREIKQPFRYCATLQKGGLETAEDVAEYVTFAREQGAQDVYLRQLFQIAPEVSRNPGVLEYIERRFVPASPIVKELLKQGFSMETDRADFQGRKKREYKLLDNKGFPVFVSELEIGREQAQALPYLVVMPNGELYSTWCGETHNIKSLREYAEEKAK